VPGIGYRKKMGWTTDRNQNSQADILIPLEMGSQSEKSLWEAWQFKCGMPIAECGFKKNPESAIRNN
jgi:hypothetical protein